MLGKSSMLNDNQKRDHFLSRETTTNIKRSGNSRSQASSSYSASYSAGNDLAEEGNKYLSMVVPKTKYVRPKRFIIMRIIKMTKKKLLNKIHLDAM